MSKEYFGQYKVESELGRGGMGVVYKAYDDALSRHVAIKVLSEQLATDDSVVERFKREAKSMAALNDASIIQIYFIGEDEGQPYFVMEYVEGESLSERLKRSGRLPIAECLDILKQACRGLSVAHDRGVVHRDIKPGNLMLSNTGGVKLADFGIAMVQDLSKRLTNTGEFVGTPGYLSPEVCIGQPVDQRSDIFAMGIVLYEMLTGDIPFTEASPLGMMLEVVKAEIPDVRSVNADVDDRTCQILTRMIAKDPDQRYPDCHELLADLNGSHAIAAPAPVAGPGAAPGSFQQARTTALSQLEELPDMGTGSVEATRVSGPGAQLPPAPPPPAVKPSDNEITGQRETRSGPRWLPAAIAALLLMGIAGGALFVFQDELLSDGTPTDVKVSSAQTVDPDSATGSTPSSDDRAAELRSSDRQSDSSSTDSVEPSKAADISGEDLEQALLAAVETDAAESTEDGLTNANTTALQLASANTSDGAKEVLSDARQTSTKVIQLKQVEVAEATSQPVAVAQVPRPVTQQNSPAKKAPLQVASVPAQPMEPRMVVMAVGDRALAGPVEQLLENALLDRDLDVLDEAFLPDIGRFADDSGVDLAGLSGVIQAGGADVLVLAEIDYIGETQLTYYGQSSTLYSVNVKIRNISLKDRRPLGRGWTRKVDFTTLNVAEKAEEEVGPIVGDVADALVSYTQR
ncbi:MAG: serine/threonine-protein kinase [Lysobacterales bacterium]